MLFRRVCKCGGWADNYIFVWFLNYKALKKIFCNDFVRNFAHKSRIFKKRHISETITSTFLRKSSSYIIRTSIASISNVQQFPASIVLSSHLCVNWPKLLLTQLSMFYRDSTLARTCNIYKGPDWNGRAIKQRKLVFIELRNSLEGCVNGRVTAFAV